MSSYDLPAPASPEALQFEWLEAECDTPDPDDVGCESDPGHPADDAPEPSTADVSALTRELARLRAVALCAARRLEDGSRAACPTDHAVIVQTALLLRQAVAG